MRLGTSVLRRRTYRCNSTLGNTCTPSSLPACLRHRSAKRNHTLRQKKQDAAVADAGRESKFRGHVTPIPADVSPPAGWVLGALRPLLLPCRPSAAQHETLATSNEQSTERWIMESRMYINLGFDFELWKWKRMKHFCISSRRQISACVKSPVLRKQPVPLAR